MVAALSKWAFAVDEWRESRMDRVFIDRCLSSDQYEAAQALYTFAGFDASDEELADGIAGGWLFGFGDGVVYDDGDRLYEAVDGRIRGW